jgi:hypothetical protein
MAAAKLVECTVSPGRVVHADVTKYQVWDTDKKAMVDAYRAGKAVGPGGTVSVTPEDAERLQALGFVVKPGVAQPPTGNGPSFGADEGPSIIQST